MNTYDIDNTVNAPISDVWNALQDPSAIISEWNAKIEKTSNSEWREIADKDLYNDFKATFKDNTVHITSINSKYSSESNDITITLEEMDANTTSVKVHYEVKTGAIFNKISLKLFGDKIVHHADNVIMKNIKKKLK